MYAVLEIASGPHKGKTVEVRPGQAIQVGRHEPAAVAVRDDAMLSNVHFALDWDGSTCRLRDLNSRFGTTVNQARVTETVLHDADRIVAGTTHFVVRVVGEGAAQGSAATAPVAGALAELPATDGSPPVTSGPPEKAIHDRVIEVLRGQPEPLFALLDAARDSLVLARLQHCGEEFQSLYEGPQGEAMAAFGPFLVSLPKGSPFLEALVREGWAKSWGVYLTCKEPFKEVRKHLRRFLRVKLPDGREVFFRFYDPRVLRVFLATCTPQEIKAFFGPIGCYLAEAAEADRILGFGANERGVMQAALPADPCPGSGRLGMPMMFQIRQEQIEALARPAVREFENAMVAHVEQFFPDSYAALGEGKTREAIRYGIQRAAHYGIQTRRDVCKYLSLMFTFGADFDTDRVFPWARAILNGWRHPSLKVQRLYAVAKKNLRQARGIGAGHRR